MNKFSAFLISCLILLAATACSPEEESDVLSEPFISDRGAFSYTVVGAVDTFQMGRTDFYRAGTHVVIVFASRTDPLRLELAYEETRANHTGLFPIVQERDPGGFVLLFQNFEESYWQTSGTLDISVSNSDTIIGRLDDVHLAWAPDPEMYPDSIKEIELVGHFEAY